MNVFWKIIGFFTGILVAIVLPWRIKKVATLQDKINESMEFATDVQLFSTEDLVYLFGSPIEKEVSEEELMAPHKPRVGVWVAEDALTGVPYVRQNGEWVQIGRDY